LLNGIATDRNVSAISSSRAQASRRARSGPDTTVQPSLSCGEPARLLRPSSVKLSTSSLGAERRAGPSPSGNSAKTSSLITGKPSAASAARSASLAYCPVGLFGETLITARARGVTARRSESRSMCQAPSYAKRYGSACTPRALPMLEQRVAWRRHQHGVARIAQQLEQEAVRLAGARGEQDVRRVGARGARQRFARRNQTERLGR